MDNPDSKETTPTRRIVALLVVLSSVCGLVILVPVLVIGWFGGSFVDWVPPKTTVTEATDEIEQERDPILDSIQEDVALVSRPEVDFATRGEPVEGPSSSTDDVSCGINLIAHGFSITSVTYFSSPDRTVPELLLLADETLIASGFEHTRDTPVQEIADEIAAYIDNGAEGPQPEAVYSEAEELDMGAELRYDAPGEQLELVIHGPCYRRE